MRAGLVQLPVPEHRALYAGANQPLAAGYLAAFARQHCTHGDWQVEILPAALADYGGDAAIVNWVVQGNFDAVGFTLYLWNRDRSLALARTIRRYCPEILLLAGGPEVASAGDAPLNAAAFPEIDLLCVGEGEEFFTRLLSEPAGMARRGLYRASVIADLARVPNPHLTGVLPVNPGAILGFEQMRGCAQKCAYCYYGKGVGGIRHFPAERMGELFRLARNNGASEIYFMDPTFNHRAHLDDYLRQVARLNQGALPIHTEVRLETIDSAIADAMLAAGVRSVEAGLQSINPQALAAVGRHFAPAAFLRGARLLQERGIEVRTGIIIGLPHDSLEDFLATLDFLRDARLLETTECYPLALLPGTALRSGAARLGLRALSHPPYWVTATDVLRTEDLATAISILERRTRGAYFPPVSPLPPAVGPELLAGIDLRAIPPDVFRKQASFPARLANSITLLVNDTVLAHPDFAALARELVSATAHTLWRIVRFGNAKWPRRDQEKLRQLFLLPHHYLDRGDYLRPCKQKILSVRLFQVVAEPAAALSWLREDDNIAEPLIQPAPGQSALWEDSVARHPWLLARPDLLPDDRARIQAWYADCPEYVIPFPASWIQA